MQTLQSVNQISFKNILFLTDFSEASSTALAYATGLARHYNAQLYPAHASNPIVLTESAANIMQEVEENSHERLIELAKRTGVNSIPLFARGRVEDALPRWIMEHGIDLIVLGTHGRHGLSHFLLGSTAEIVFRTATCPVLTVGPHVTIRPYQGFRVDSILFPTDLGPHAEFATQYALSVAQENHAALTFMHVIPMDQAFQNDRRALVTEAYKKLRKIVSEDAKDICKPEFVVEVGDPLRELLGQAETVRPDLIVLGLPAGKKFNGHFRTSVAYNLVANAPCPVLTLRDVLSDD